MGPGDSMKKCPFIGAATMPFNGRQWQCTDQTCRFNLDGDCAILVAAIEAKASAKRINSIAEALNIPAGK